VKLIRKARKSVYTTLEGLFTAGTLLGTAYNVYDEDDLRAGVIPTRPFVFILDYGAQFELRSLPAIVVQMGVRKRPLGLGEMGYYCYLVLHVFGRNRGERDDITSAIMDAVDAIDVRDFDTVDSPVTQTMQLESISSEGDIWIEEVIELPGRLLLEGTAANWVSLMTGFWVTDVDA
jgi:hypothetical protein